MNNFIKLLFTLILTLSFSSLCVAEIDDDLAIRAIIGEASNQGSQGMLAVACGIRNRGTLKGVYGLNAKHVDNEPQWVWDLARKAWEKSAHKDIVREATHWENNQAFGKPYWAKDMIEVITIGDHIFYKVKVEPK